MPTPSKAKPVKLPASDLAAEHAAPSVTEEAALRQFTAISVSQLHVGPLPPPDTLAQYREVVPELPMILVDVFREQAQHRMSISRLKVESEIELSRSGQNYAMMAVVLSLASVTVLGIWGNPLTAGIVGALEVSALIGWFLRGSRQAKVRDEQRP